MTNDGVCSNIESDEEKRQDWGCTPWTLESHWMFGGKKVAWCMTSLKLINVTPMAHMGMRSCFLVLLQGLREAMMS